MAASSSSSAQIIIMFVFHIQNIQNEHIIPN